MFKKYLSLLFILLLMQFFTKIAYSSNQDTEHFKVFNNKYTLMPYFTLSKLKLNISGKYDIVYRPDRGTDLGLYGAYKNMGFGVGLGVFDYFKDEQKSTVKFYDFRFNYYGRRIGADGLFQFYKSFLVEEATNTLPDSVIAENRANQKMSSIGFNIYYNCNTEHSFKAVFSHTERQLKSNGAFLLGLSQTYTHLYANDNYFSDEEITIYNISDYSKNARLYSVVPIIGYQYNLVMGNFYFAPLVLLGAGSQFQKVSAGKDFIKNDIQFIKKVVVNLPIGYNGDKFYYGFVFKNDYSKSKIANSNMIYNLLSLNLFFGFRFL